jgi:hypothetical protein
VTNFGIAAARKDWESCPQQFSPVLRRGLQAAAERLQAIKATGGAKAGTQQRHPRAHSGFDDGPIGMRAAATRAIAATMAGALPSPTILRELFQKTIECKHHQDGQEMHETAFLCQERIVAAITHVLMLAAIRAPALPGMKNESASRIGLRRSNP